MQRGRYKIYCSDEMAVFVEPCLCTDGRSYTSHKTPTSVHTPTFTGHHLALCQAWRLVKCSGQSLTTHLCRPVSLVSHGPIYIICTLPQFLQADSDGGVKDLTVTFSWSLHWPCPGAVTWPLVTLTTGHTDQSSHWPLVCDNRRSCCWLLAK